MRYTRFWGIAAAVGMVCLLMVAIGGRSAHAVDLFSEDAAFLKDAAQAGHFELEAAQLALKQSEDQDVKHYATTMLAEHQQLADQLNVLAGERDISLPTEPSLIQKATLALFKSDEGREFDVNYARKMGVTAHKDTIEMVENYLERGSDRQILAFAKDALPVLREHFRQGDTLYKSMQIPKL